MPRPPKDPNLRMDVDLRIPVTREQKEKISMAVSLDQMEFAQWARDILIRAAERRIKLESKE